MITLDNDSVDSISNENELHLELSNTSDLSNDEDEDTFGNGYSGDIENIEIFYNLRKRKLMY